jgi:hypothetical protein
VCSKGVLVILGIVCVPKKCVYYYSKEVCSINIPKEL